MEVKEPMSDYLIPLGGGDEVGASSYFLFIDGIRILLDCGARLQRPDIEELYPDYERLLQEVSDYSDLDLILISHAHYDHIGSFAKIATLAPHAEILATQDTKRLIEVQLLEFGRISGREECLGTVSSGTNTVVADSGQTGHEDISDEEVQDYSFAGRTYDRCGDDLFRDRQSPDSLLRRFQCQDEVRTQRNEDSRWDFPESPSLKCPKYIS